MSEESNKLHISWVYLLLALITFIAFEQVRHNDFIDYDDTVYVTENQNILTGLTLENIKWAFAESHFFMWHPMTSLSHMLDCEIFGLNPYWHHLISLMFHIANTLLLFTVLRQITGGLWQSAFIAAAFALHPLNVESVAWAAERKTVLSGFFWILTIAAYARYAQHPRVANYLLVVLVFSLALMSKPITVTLPFVLLLLDYWPLNRIENISLTEHSSRQRIFRLVREKVPLFILSALCSTITFLAQRSGESVIPLAALPLRLRLTNAVVSYVRYLGKIFWPKDLAVLYPLDFAGIRYLQAVLCFLLLLIISIFAVRFGRKQRYLPVGWFWFLGTLVPVIGIVQSGGQAFADRYAYISSVGVFIMVAWGAAELLYNWKYRKSALSIAASVILFVLLTSTRTQVRFWQNSISLFEHTLSVTRNNSLIYYNLGRVYQLANNPDKAIENYREALRLAPEDPEINNNLGMMLRKQNKLDEAIAHFRKAIEINPAYAAAYSNLGRTLQLQGKFDEAIECLNHSLALEPGLPERYDALAAIYIQAGRTKQALESALHVCQMTNYSDPYFLKTLASAYAADGNFTEAVKTAEKAQELAETVGDKKLAEYLQKHLQLYKQGRPFHEE